jgi:transcriptional regulator with GAF, ATPase, and Fis domain
VAGSDGPQVHVQTPETAAGPAGVGEPLTSWIAGFGIGQPVIRDIVAALRSNGIDLVPHDEAMPLRSMGVVAFDAVTGELCEFIRDASRAGAERILGLLIPGGTTVAAHGLWELLHAGSTDVMSWRGHADNVNSAVARLRRWRAVDDLVTSPLVRGSVIGEGPAWRSVLRQVVEVGRFTNASVLITGESGTGKEMVARLIHELDVRPKKGKLVVLDCTTVVPSLSGSEFFGHDRGAYTGAVSAREGAFELADGGTLFLDEVGELSAPMQAELLRVVQEGTFKRVGSNLWRKSEFRLICATNRDLEDEQKRGTFRSDFYHRIASWKLHLPSLKDRIEDVVPLFSYFYHQHRPEAGRPRLDDAVYELLLRRPYPGNVRDLRNLAFRVSQRHVGNGPVTVGDIPEEERPGPDQAHHAWHDQAFERCIRRSIRSGATLREITAGTSETAIGIALADEGGNLHRAALRLGVTDRALQLRRAARRDRLRLEAGDRAESAVSQEPAG